MPRRPPSRRSRPRAENQAPPTPPAPVRGRLRRWWPAGLAIAIALATAAVFTLIPDSPARLRAEAERAVRDDDWPAALRAWRAFNATDSARGATYLAQAKAELKLAQARQAEATLRKAIALEPSDAEAWKLLLEILRVEDRSLEARETVWESYDRIPLEARRAVLRELTLAVLADVANERARLALNRWIDADPLDVDARVALLRRMAAQPRSEDPGRPSRLLELEELVAAHPTHPGAREALVTALGDAGEPDRGRALLDSWPGPEDDRDGRYWRLRGRWALEYDHDPAHAANAFRRAVATFPHDWRAWSGLARSLARLGRADEARHAADSVARIREALEPSPLLARLDNDFRTLDDPRSRRDLAELAGRVGLARLAEAWRADAEVPTEAEPQNPPVR
ncbi:MAG: tetratricopeptide repeat protein [Isosphaeraceae bacterium]